MARFPEQFGKYVLLRKIAKGGMAEIFLAKNVGAEGFEKDLVIKRILPHFSEDEEFVTMFVDEASIASKLAHANIVQIYDFDQVDGAFYIAMEYVNGKDLKDVIGDGLKQGRPLSPAQTVSIIIELAKALHYAHTKTHAGTPLNIVHRDVSPQNAMISFGGEVKLMDFGIAKAASRSTHTVAGTVKGKCAYMSPEQAKGQQLDGRSDVFALGVVAWEMLTGKRLFLAESDFMTLTNVLKQEAPPPSSINPSVPPDLDAIMLKSLEKDREDRFASGQHFERALTKWFYTNADLDAAALAPYMTAMYAGDIEVNKQKSAQERTMFMTTSDGPLGDAGQPPPSPDEATRMLSGGMENIQAATTMMDGDMSPADVDQLRGLANAMAASHDDATRMLGAMPAAPMNDQATRMMGAMPDVGIAREPAITPPQYSLNDPGPKQSTAWIWMLAALVLLALGGVATWYFVVGPGAASDEARRPSTVASRTSGQNNVTQGSDGADSTGRAAGTGATKDAATKRPAVGDDRPKPGSGEARADDGAARRGGDATEDPDELVIEDEPDVAKAAGGDGAGAKESGKTLDGGAGPAGGQPAGAPVVDTLAPDGAVKPAVAAETPKKAKTTQILVSCDPAGTVSANVGTAENQGMAWVIKDVPLGSTVKVTCFKKGFATQVQDVIAQHGVQLPFSLRKIAIGYGNIVVNAKPWAKCSVANKRNATTPVKIKRVRSGKYRVVCKHRGSSKSAVLRVRPNRTATKLFTFKR